MPAPPVTTVVRILFGTFGLVFFGIGMTVIVALWSGGMGSPPIFFRIFGSLIAIPFMAVGGTLAFGAFTGKISVGPRQLKRSVSTRLNQSTDYTCPGCGAKLDGKSDVSPHGDVKCQFCNSWFNIHS